MSTVTRIDTRTDAAVAGFAVLAAGAGAVAEVWPLAAAGILLALAVGLALYLRRADRLERERLQDAGDTICTADDMHLAEVAHAGAEEHRA